MPIIEPDLSETGGSVIPASTRKGKIVGVEARISKSSQTPGLKVDWEIDVDGVTFNRTTYPPTAGKGAFMFEQLLRATHFDDIADQLVAGEKPKFDTDNLLQQECNLVIENGIYNGRPNDEIKSYLKL